MARFVKKSKIPKNCVSNHRLIGLLICRGMGISNNPLPTVAAQPQSVNLERIAPVLETATHGPLPEPLPLVATTVQTPTITVCKTTQKINRVTRSHPSTKQTSLDEFSLQQPVALEKQIDEETTARPQSQHLADTLIIEIQPPASNKKHPPPTSALPKKRARIAWSTITSRPLTPLLRHQLSHRPLLLLLQSHKILLLLL
jgi:hypothetical protein